MKQVHLTLGFKGQRHYIHGTDIYNEMTHAIKSALLPSLNDVAFTIHQMTDKNLTMTLEVANTSSVKQATPHIADLKFVSGGKVYIAKAYAEETVPNTRTPYDETLITNHCDIYPDTQHIVLGKNVSGYSPIEVLVAMNKALHLAVLQKPENTNWVFCRWDCAVWPLPCKLNLIEISIEQVLGSRLTKAKVHIASETFGYLYFSAKAD